MLTPDSSLLRFFISSTRSSLNANSFLRYFSLARCPSLFHFYLYTFEPTPSQRRFLSLFLRSAPTFCVCLLHGISAASNLHFSNLIYAEQFFCQYPQDKLQNERDAHTYWLFIDWLMADGVARALPSNGTVLQTFSLVKRFGNIQCDWKLIRRNAVAVTPMKLLFNTIEFPFPSHLCARIIKLFYFRLSASASVDIHLR